MEVSIGVVSQTVDSLVQVLVASCSSNLPVVTCRIEVCSVNTVYELLVLPLVAHLGLCVGSGRKHLGQADVEDVGHSVVIILLDSVSCRSCSAVSPRRHCSSTIKSSSELHVLDLAVLGSRSRTCSILSEAGRYGPRLTVRSFQSEALSRIATELSTIVSQLASYRQPSCLGSV